MACGPGVPAGMARGRQIGPKDACLAYIKEVWTDMRPLSVRKQMEAARTSNL